MILQQHDDVCLLHLDNAVVDSTERDQFARQLIEFIERGGCRKLLITCDGVEGIRGLLSERQREPRDSSAAPVATSEPVSVGTDFWVG
jgi:hypothetical protein